MVQNNVTSPPLRSPEPRRFGFLLLPEFTQIALSSAVEALRVANMVTGKEVYSWHMLTPDDNPVRASNGMEVTPDLSSTDLSKLIAVFVVGGLQVEKHTTKEALKIMSQFSKTKRPFGALCTGTYTLAKAGLLDGYRCTVHWENIDSLREQFPKVTVTTELYEIDENRLTCSGGIASIDMFLSFIKDHLGHEVAAAVSEELLVERMRGPNDRQRIPLVQRLGTSQPKLVEAVTLMESNIEEPITLDELSQHVNLSRRQLERLFQKYLKTVPTKYYLELRLRRARQLLLQTSKSIVEVAFACGFVSAPHFSKCYRDFFGIPPREERRQSFKTD